MITHTLSQCLETHEFGFLFLWTFCLQKFKQKKHQLQCEVRDFTIFCLRGVRQLGNETFAAFSTSVFFRRFRPILRGVGCCDTIDSMFQVGKQHAVGDDQTFEVDAVERIWETIKNSKCFDCILAKKEGMDGLRCE